MERSCVAFADGQAFVFGSAEGDPRTDVLAAFFETARQVLGRVRESACDNAIFRHGRVERGSRWFRTDGVHAELHEKHPIRVDAGFEGNSGVDGGVWRPTDHGEDGLVHLRFSVGTEDLPLHIHEFSDRLIVVTSGIGLFHYLPATGATHELRSLLVEAGDVLIFTRGLIHTFTAPIGDLMLLSYHSPFFELDDARQYSIPQAIGLAAYAWAPRGLLRQRAPFVGDGRSAVA